MSWSQTATHEWRAPLDSHEQLHDVIKAPSLSLQREHWSITAVLRLQTKGRTPENLESALKQAWIMLRFEHPSIAARLDAVSGEKVYNTPQSGSADIEQWVEETFVVVDGSTRLASTSTHDPLARTAEELFANFKPHDLTTLYFLRDSCEIVYHTSHWRTDGFGVIMLLGRLLSLSCSSLDPASLKWGEEVSRLHSSMESLLEVPINVPQAGQDLIDQRVSRIASSMPSAGIRYKGANDKLPGGTRQVSLAFNADSTSALVAACRTASLPVSVAINAASVRATFAHEADHSSDRPYSSAVPTDLRYLLSPPYNGPAYASNFSMTGHAIIVPRGQSFMETAQTLAAQYRDDMVTPTFVTGARAWAKAFRTMLSTPPPEDWAPPSEIGNSSLGIIERWMPSEYVSEDGERAISVTAFRLGVEMMTRQPELHYWTWRDHLTLSVSFNEAYHEDAGMREVLGTIQRELELGFAISLVPAS